MICRPLATLCLAIALSPCADSETVTFVWHNGLVTTQPYYSGQFLPATNKAVNDSGSVTGSVQNPITLLRTAATWRGATLSEYGTLPGFTESIGKSINNHGSVVGGSIYAGSLEPTAWINGSIIDLGILPGITGPFGTVGGLANSLNESNQIVGFQYSNSGAIPVLWEHGTAHQLATLPGQDTAEPLDINETGTIVGYSGNRAVTWQNGTISALPGCDAGSAYAINDRGDIAGNCGSDAVVWDASGMSIIGPDVALGIDNNGTVVGRTSDNPLLSQTYTWSAIGGLQTLPGFVWSQPFSISRNSSYIVGYGELAPEPATIGLCCGGLLLVLALGRKKSKFS